jgi:exopolyphosphatase/guanosine-5'-triphosphate,3'-diphosphate pyrophosphatase
MSRYVIQPLSPPPAGDGATGLGRLAAIDIGSNSIHMIVVAPEPHGGYRVLGREREMVRLGKSALGEGALSEEAMERGLSALVKMTTLARLKGADRAVAVATSAVREASNGAEFLARVKAQTGLDPERLSGDEEGRLIYRAVREVVDLGPTLAAIVDIGGGSTEWITVRAGALEGVVSLPLGSLRLADRLLEDLPPRAQIERLRRELAERIATGIPAGGVERLVATSGTAVCAADLIDLFSERARKSAGLREVRLSDLILLGDRLAAMGRRAVASLPPVGKPRAESLLPGTLLLQELVRRAGVDRFQVSDRALREGLVLEALGQPIPEAAEPEDLRRRQILQLARRAEGVFAHDQQTARLAVRLFDVTTSLHGLGAREREWLEYAALLHDLGYSVQYRGHHKHSAYLILHANLDAFDPREIEILAAVARFHRGAAPRPSHPALEALKPWQQKVVGQLSALLRVADSLDRTHASRVDEIYASIRRRKVVLEVISPYEVELELESVRASRRLFEKVFDRELQVRQGLEIARL